MQQEQDVQPHILIVNPNSSSSMTQKIERAARLAARPSTRITAVNPPSGPKAIQGPEDGEAALPGLFALVAQHLANDPTIRAVIIACFDDTGLWALKQQCAVPVIGIGEAAYVIASLFGPKFSVVTTLSVSVPVLEENLTQMGFVERCAKVRASEVPVLDLEAQSGEAFSKISAEVGAALEEDDVSAIALGCAGMTDLALTLSASHKIPAVDGVKSAVALCEAIIA